MAYKYVTLKDGRRKRVPINTPKEAPDKQLAVHPLDHEIAERRIYQAKSMARAILPQLDRLINRRQKALEDNAEGLKQLAIARTKILKAYDEGDRTTLVEIAGEYGLGRASGGTLTGRFHSDQPNFKMIVRESLAIDESAEE